MQAAQNLLKTARKSFTLQDLIRHEGFRYKNLVEMLAEYPHKGVGFRVSKIYWPENHYIKVFRADLETNRVGKIYGRKYIEGAPVNDRIFEVDRASTRGLWRYDLGDSFHVADNGMVYTISDFKKHFSTVVQRKPKRPEDMRKNIAWEAPKSDHEPVENENNF